MSGADDPTILRWCAEEGRILLTHDVNTITKHAYERMESGLPVTGVLEVSLDASMGQIVDDPLLIIELSLEGEWENRIAYIPLK